MTMHSRLGRAFSAGFLALGMMLAANAVSAQQKVRVALGDVVSEETLAFIVALERAKERGVDYELTSFAEEDLAIQAIVGGQSDLGIGTPYAVIQKAKVPLRAIFQMSSLVFFPVVSTEYESWKDLDGQPFAFNSRGSATEAYGDVMAAREGITFGERTYVSGSGNRVIALMNGTIKATILDLSNKNKILEQAPDKFHVLPGVDERVSEKPGIIEEERVTRNLLADQPAEVIEEVPDYYEEGVESGIWNPEGASADLAKADFKFYVDAGQLEGPADSLKVEDYWDLSIIEAARKNLGG